MSGVTNLIIIIILFIKFKVMKLQQVILISAILLLVFLSKNI
jgi:hypothetical protein